MDISKTSNRKSFKKATDRRDAYYRWKPVTLENSGFPRYVGIGDRIQWAGHQYFLTLSTTEGLLIDRWLAVIKEAGRFLRICTVFLYLADA